MSTMVERVKALELFYSYSHVDERWRQRLEIHLSTLQRQGYVTGWHDQNISAGTVWSSEINTHLNNAHIILLLISPDFIASEYCYSIEMMRAIQRHKNGEAKVIPVILRPTDWKGTPFEHLQALPTNARPVTRWQDRDEALLDVTKGIRKAIEELNAKLSITSSLINSEEISVSEKEVMDWLVNHVYELNGRVSVDLGDIPGVKHSMRMMKNSNDWESWYGTWFHDEFTEHTGSEPTEKGIRYALEKYGEMLEE